MAGGKNIGGPIATDAQGFVRNTCDTQAHARIQGAHARCPRAGKDEANGDGVDFSQPAKSLQISSSTESLPSKRRQRRSKRPTKHSPPAIPIILAALLSAAALQPAGDGGKEVYHCICARFVPPALPSQTVWLSFIVSCSALIYKGRLTGSVAEGKPFNTSRAAGKSFPASTSIEVLTGRATLAQSGMNSIRRKTLHLAQSS
eukprot:3504623-Rhodomonas_salina.2